MHLIPLCAGYNFRGTGKLFTIAVVVFFCKQAALSQAEFFTGRYHWTMENGLCHNAIKHIVRDTDGFLWLGTEDGLCRFDGLEFISFEAMPGQPGLAGNHIYALIPWKGRQMLVGSTGGLQVLNTLSGKFQDIPLPDLDTSKQERPWVLAAALENSHRVWVVTNEGLVVFDEQFQPVASLSLANDSRKGIEVRAIYQLPDGNVVLLSDFKQCWMLPDFQQRKWVLLRERFPDLVQLDSIFPTRTEGMGKDPQGNIWFTRFYVRDFRLFRLNAKSNCIDIWTVPLENDPRSNQRLWKPVPINDSVILVHRAEGVPFLFNLNSGSVTDVPIYDNAYVDGKGTACYTDPQGNLWTGPRFEGLYCFPLRKSAFEPLDAVNKVIASKPNAASSLDYGYLATLFGGKYYFACTVGGFIVYDPVSGTAVDLGQKKLPGYTYINQPPFPLPSDPTAMWLVSDFGGQVFRPQSGKLASLPKSLDTLAASSLVFKDRQGLLWGHDREGIIQLNLATGQVKHIKLGGADSPGWKVANKFTEDENGDIWMADWHQNHLLRWERSTGHIVAEGQNKGLGMGFKVLRQIMADHKGRIWIAAEEGLFSVETASKKVRRYGTPDGLARSFVTSISFDKNGFLWVGSIFGLSRLDPGDGSFRRFYKADGLPGNAVREISLIDTLQNLLMLSTDAGLCLFHPDLISGNPAPPKPCITGLTASGVEKPCEPGQAVRLGYAQNDLMFRFAGILFPEARGIQFQYKLDGANDAWLDAGSSRFANYANLPPGTYTFFVRAANANGVWSGASEPLILVIRPPFWETWPFRMALLAALLAGGWFLYRRQLRQALQQGQQKNLLLHQMAELEMKALRSQMNPHFVFNALASIQNFVLDNNAREASKYLSKFARLMRLILENSESPLVNLAKEIEHLQYYVELEALRFNRQFSFHLELGPALNADLLSIPAMLIQPHIENAIWHGLLHKNTTGNLWLRFHLAHEQTLLCEIEDDGIGRGAASELNKNRRRTHESKGIANIQHRLELLRQEFGTDMKFEIEDLTDRAGNPTGTKVTLKLPIFTDLGKS